MNRPISVFHQRRAVADDSDDKRTNRSARTRGHAVVPSSLRLGEVVSTATAERIAFELTLVDGRTLRGRIALRVLTDDSLVKVYPKVTILHVERKPR